MAKKQTVFSMFEEVVDLIDSAKPDAYRFYIHKNLRAGIRMRNKLMKVRKLSSLIRKQSLEIQKKQLESYEKRTGFFGPARGWFGNSPKRVQGLDE